MIESRWDIFRTPARYTTGSTCDGLHELFTLCDCGSHLAVKLLPQFARTEAAVADGTIRARLTCLTALHRVFQPAHSLLASLFHVAGDGVAFGSGEAHHCQAL